MDSFTKSVEYSLGEIICNYECKKVKRKPSRFNKKTTQKVIAKVLYKIIGVDYL